MMHQTMPHPTPWVSVSGFSLQQPMCEPTLRKCETQMATLRAEVAVMAGGRGAALLTIPLLGAAGL
eukprot:scaffold20079_cov28-Tisochrysis_lutea.AAC.1